MVHDCWLVLKVHLLEAEEWSIPTCRKAREDAKKPTGMKKFLLKTQTQEVEARSGHPGSNTEMLSVQGWG